MSNDYNFLGRGRHKDLHPNFSTVRNGWENMYVIDEAEGVRLVGGVYPHRSLPVGAFMDSVQDWMVLPKGKLVSYVGAACGETTQTDIGTGPNAFYVPTDDAEFPVYPSGEPPFEPIDISADVAPAPDLGIGYDSYVTITGEDYGAYSNEIISLMVPANGGMTAVHGFSTDDELAGTPIYNTVTDEWEAVDDSDTDALEIPANKPVGMVYKHVLRDITGKYLSWKNQESVTVLTDYQIQLPFVNLELLEAEELSDDTAAGLALVDDVNNLTNANPLYELSRIWAFSYALDDECSDGFLAPGSTVYPDLHGNYVFANHSTAATAAFAAGINDPTLAEIMAKVRSDQEQEIGNLISMDHRFPKQYLDNVDTYYRSGAGAGTSTGGMPWHLFAFAQDLLILMGVAQANRKINDILSYAQHGVFGMVRINIHIS